MSAPRVLVVEDSPTQARLLRLILEAEGFTVDVAGDGQAALTRLAAASFDLVVSDVLMPGLTGFELCRVIKADPALCDIPVVLVTTLREPLEIVQALEVGADSFVRKPYEPDALVVRLRSLLAQRAQQTKTAAHSPRRRRGRSGLPRRGGRLQRQDDQRATRTASRSCGCCWGPSRTWCARTPCCASARRSCRWPRRTSRRRRG